MGSALADTLMTQGFELQVWNRSHDKCERFADAGVRVGGTVEAIASECERLGVCGKLPRAISDYFESALSRGHGGSELPVLFEVLGKTEP